MSPFRKSIKWILAGLIVGLLFLIFMPSCVLFSPNRNRAQFGACEKMLDGIRDATDHYLSDQPGLNADTITKEGVLQYFLPSNGATTDQMEEIMSANCDAVGEPGKKWSFDKALILDQSGGADFCFSGQPKGEAAKIKGVGKVHPTIYVGSTGACPRALADFLNHNGADLGGCPGMNGVPAGCY